MTGNWSSHRAGLASLYMGIPTSQKPSVLPSAAPLASTRSGQSAAVMSHHRHSAALGTFLAGFPSASRRMRAPSRSMKRWSSPLTGIWTFPSG